MTEPGQPAQEPSESDSALRVRPTALIGFGIAIGYVVLFLALETMMGVPYTELGTTSDSVLRGIVIPLAIMAVVMAAVTTWLGWWQPVMRDKPLGVAWMWAIPAVLLAVVLIGVNWAQIGALGATYLIWLALGTLLVGFNEEITFRGLALVGFRGQYQEVYAWLLSTLLFGLLHGANLILGQGAALTLRQIAFAFVLGTVFYIARRVTGSLAFLMIVHALWDFGAFSYVGGLAATGVNGANRVAIASLPLIVVLLVMCAIGAKKVFATPVVQAK